MPNAKNMAAYLVTIVKIGSTHDLLQIFGYFKSNIKKFLLITSWRNVTQTTK
jgi:hypothetical protein